MTDILIIPPAAQAFVLAAQADANMTCRQVAILLTVCAYPGESNKALAQALGVSAPIITRAADKLVDLGLMNRYASTADRRKVELTVTPAGARLVREITSA